MTIQKKKNKMFTLSVVLATKGVASSTSLKNTSIGRLDVTLSTVAKRLQLERQILPLFVLLPNLEFGHMVNTAPRKIVKGTGQRLSLITSACHSVSLVILYCVVLL